MLKAMEQKWNQKKAVWSDETAQRIREYAGLKRVESLKKMKKEEEMNRLLHQEIGHYLQTIHPSFMLNPNVSRALYNRLLARTEDRFCFSFHVNSEMRLALDFYNSDLSIFLRLLEKKGFVLAGNEARFLTAFLNKLSENNYRLYLDLYGLMLNESTSLQEGIYKYLEVVPEQNKFDSGRIDFLRKYLISQGLLSSEWTNKKVKKLVKTYEKAYEEDNKLIRLEKRMYGVG